MSYNGFKWFTIYVLTSLPLFIMGLFVSFSILVNDKDFIVDPETDQNGISQIYQNLPVLKFEPIHFLFIFSFLSV